MQARSTPKSQTKRPHPAIMNILRRPRCMRLPRTHSLAARWQSFSLTALQSKNLPPRPKPPPDSEIQESFLKGSGPGGQKINKTNSAVQLKHVPTGIVVKSQATRSRSQNRKHARELLAQKVDDLLHGEQSRSSIVGQVKKKKAASAAKKSRRKYTKLDEEREAGKEHDEPEQPLHEPDGSDQVQGEANIIEETKHPQENKRP